jgi:putative FmdB family regulatory protein
MPRYSYYCEFCEQSSEVFHSINDQQEECIHCLKKGGLVKLVSRPVINTAGKTTDTTVKERVEGHIEEARQELTKQRSELVKEDLINDN